MDLTPAQQIADLDEKLSRRGTLVKLRKTNTAVGQVEVLASWRQYKGNEIAGIIVAGDKLVVLSPTGLETYGIPKANEWVVLNGVQHRIKLPHPHFDGGVFVRLELHVSGAGL